MKSENSLRNRARQGDLPGLGAPLGAAEGRRRHLVASPGGRAGVLAAMSDFLAGRNPQGGARGPGREPKSRGR